MLHYIFNCFRVCRVLYQRETKIKNPLQSKQTAENIHSETIFLNADLPYKTLNEHYLFRSVSQPIPVRRCLLEGIEATATSPSH